MHDHSLSAAVVIWRSGNFITSHHWAVLAGRGYDMHRLEAVHLN